MKISQKIREFLLQCGDSPLVTMIILIFAVLTIVSLGGIDELIIGSFIIVAIMMILLFLSNLEKRRNVS